MSLETTVDQALSLAFRAADSHITAYNPSAGSTATVAVVDTKDITVAHCGDSRALLVRCGQVIALTEDHRPSRTDERERILAAGGQILWNEGERVMGVLATTRTFGDIDLKQFGVTAEPEILTVPRTPEDELLILATDGVSNVLSNTEVADVATRVVRRALERGASRAAAIRMAASAIGRFSRDRNSKDDITVIVADLTQPHAGQPSQGQEQQEQGQEQAPGQEQQQGPGQEQQQGPGQEQQQGPGQEQGQGQPHTGQGHGQQGQPRMGMEAPQQEPGQQGPQAMEVEVGEQAQQQSQHAQHALGSGLGAYPGAAAPTVPQQPTAGSGGACGAAGLARRPPPPPLGLQPCGGAWPWVDVHGCDVGAHPAQPPTTPSPSAPPFTSSPFHSVASPNCAAAAAPVPVLAPAPPGPLGRWGPSRAAGASLAAHSAGAMECIAVPVVAPPPAEHVEPAAKCPTPPHTQRSLPESTCAAAAAAAAAAGTAAASATAVANAVRGLPPIAPSLKLRSSSCADLGCATAASAAAAAAAEAMLYGADGRSAATAAERVSLEEWAASVLVDGHSTRSLSETSSSALESR